MRDQRKFEIVVWVRKTEGFAALRDEAVDLAREEPFESTEYEGMVDFHWRFDTLPEAEGVAKVLSTLCDRPELVLLRLSNYDNLNSSTTFKDARRVEH